MPMNRRRFLPSLFFPAGTLARGPFLMALLVVMGGLLYLLVAGCALGSIHPEVSAFLFGGAGLPTSWSGLVSLAGTLLFVHALYTCPLVCIAIQRVRGVGGGTLSMTLVALCLVAAGGLWKPRLTLLGMGIQLCLMLLLFLWPSRVPDQHGQPGLSFVQGCRADLACFFSSRGTLGRLLFFQGILVVTLLLELPLYTLSQWVLEQQSAEVAPGMVAKLGLLALQLAYFWVSLCLFTKRMRRVGWPLFLTTPLVFLLLLCDILPEGNELFQTIVDSGQVTLLLLLLLWPDKLEPAPEGTVTGPNSFDIDPDKV